MKTLKIFRTECTQCGTFGQFELCNEDGDIIMRGYTCEPAGEPTAEANKNRPILGGSYRARMRFSPKFSPRTKNRKLPILSSEDLDEARCILIHGGNYPRDTQGCILVGEYFINDAENISGVGASMKTLHALLDELEGHDFAVEIH